MKFLIIASPKSASTSLMKGLSNITGLSAKQEYFKDNKENYNFDLFVRALNKIFKNLQVTSNKYKESKKLRHVFPSHEFPLLSKFHSDIADLELSIDFSKLFKNDIHKQHFPPTKKNITLFRNIKKIILLRSPQEIVESYLREPFNENLYYLQNKIQSDVNFRNAITSELEKWVNNWYDSEKNNKNSLIIYYDDILRDHVSVINKILDFYNIQIAVDSNYSLPQERYYKIK